MPRITPAPEMAQARAMQLENDTAALYLVRRATQIEESALRASEDGNTAGATNKLGRARTFRAVAKRLVLTDRPQGLGVPTWLGLTPPPPAAEGPPK